MSARAGEAATSVNLFDLSLSQALGTAPKTAKFDFASSKLGKVIQLAGFSDPVYTEAYVNVNQYDIVLDVLVVNQTADTLQNLSLEFSTVGDLKLVDKPTPITIAPHDFTNIKATVKVTSTENGVIFSTISYDVRGSTSDRNCVYLQDIHIDIMVNFKGGLKSNLFIFRTILCLALVRIRSSAECGQILSGKTKWQSIQRLRICVNI